VVEQALQFDLALPSVAEPNSVHPERFRSLDIRRMVVDKHGLGRG
jgi:hypothetical protein